MRLAANPQGNSRRTALRHWLSPNSPALPTHPNPTTRTHAPHLPAARPQELGLRDFAQFSGWVLPPGAARSATGAAMAAAAAAEAALEAGLAAGVPPPREKGLSFSELQASEPASASASGAAAAGGSAAGEEAAATAGGAGASVQEGAGDLAWGLYSSEAGLAAAISEGRSGWEEGSRCAGQAALFFFFFPPFSSPSFFLASIAELCSPAAPQPAASASRPCLASPQALPTS